MKAQTQMVLSWAGLVYDKANKQEKITILLTQSSEMWRRGWALTKSVNILEIPSKLLVIQLINLVRISRIIINQKPDVNKIKIQQISDS